MFVEIADDDIPDLPCAGIERCPGRAIKIAEAIEHAHDVRNAHCAVDRGGGSAGFVELLPAHPFGVGGRGGEEEKRERQVAGDHGMANARPRQLDPSPILFINGHQGKFGAIIDTKLLVDGVEIHLHRAFTDAEFRPDIAIAHPARDERGDLAFARVQL